MVLAAQESEPSVELLVPMTSQLSLLVAPVYNPGPAVTILPARLLILAPNVVHTSDKCTKRFRSDHHEVDSFGLLDGCSRPVINRTGQLWILSAMAVLSGT